MKNLRRAFVLLLITLLCGTAGFRFIEGWPLFDAFYMTVITISTVGYGEIHPLSTAGRLLAVIIISTGIMVGGYTIGTFLRLLIEGELRKTFGRRKVEKSISHLKNHVIICGYGRIGRLMSQELRTHGKDFVVIERTPEAIIQMEEDRVLYLPLDATLDDSLMKAGIMTAQAIVPAVGDDADNIYITLTARGLRPDIFILARASDEKNEVKLKRAGATRVVSPYLIGGKRMAHVLIRPTVIDFIDIAVMEGNMGLQMEEIKVMEKSTLVGKNLVESNLRRDYGVIIVLIKKFNGDMIFNPQSSERLDANDLLVVLGKKEDMKRMREVI